MAFIPLTVENVLQYMAKVSPENEISGLLSSDFTIYPIDNVARNKKSSFIMNAKQYSIASNNIKQAGNYIFCLFHSHPDGILELSKADIETMVMQELDMLLITPKECRMFAWRQYAR